MSYNQLVNIFVSAYYKTVEISTISNSIMLKIIDIKCMEMVMLLNSVGFMEWD
jgi:hypothetical protein